MDLGTTISRLRTERNMSQGDLAEALDVSRQSISKWETNASVPELDKLVKLSRLFGVSLDELVTGEAPPAPEPASPPAPEPPLSSAAPGRQASGHRTVGIILLCMAFLTWLLLTVLGGPLEGLVLAAPFLACAVICFACRRRAGLWCAWTIYLCVELYLRWATGITWRLVLMTPHFTPSMNYVRLAMAYVQLLVMLLMFFLTIRAFRDVPIDLKKRKNVLLLAGGWIALAALYPLKNHLDFLIYQNLALDTMGVRLLLSFGDVLLLVLFAALLTITACGLRTLRRKSE